MTESAPTIQEFLNQLGVPLPSLQQSDKQPTLHEVSGTKCAFIGTPGAGKTVTVGGIVMRAEAKVAATAHTDNPFYCQPIERDSNIHQDVADLRDGWFPAKTQSFLGFRSSPGLLMERQKWLSAPVPIIGRIFNKNGTARKLLWHRKLYTPIIDLPGETLTQVIRQVRAKTGIQAQIIKQQIQTAINEMRESDAYIIMLKATRAKGFGTQLESEKDKTLSEDPDVNLVRMLEDLMSYKRLNTGRPVKYIAVVVCALDRLKPVADRVGFDLLDPEVGTRDMERFVAACFPATYAALQNFRLGDKVKYYPTFFQTETDDKNNELLYDREITASDGMGGTKLALVKQPKIITRDIFDPQGEWWQNARKISYSEQSFDNLLNDLMSIAQLG